MERPKLARRLRRIVHLVLLLCAVVVILAKLPGSRLYDDANHCFGASIAGLANTEHHTGHCTPSYTTLVATDDAGGWETILVVVAIALGAGIIHRRPSGANAIGWMIWSALAGFGVMVMPFDAPLVGAITVLWPSRVLTFALGTIYVLVMIATPIIILFTHEDSTDSLPAARDSSGSR